MTSLLRNDRYPKGVCQSLVHSLASSQWNISLDLDGEVTHVAIMTHAPLRKATGRAARRLPRRTTRSAGANCNRRDAEVAVTDCAAAARRNREAWELRGRVVADPPTA